MVLVVAVFVGEWQAELVDCVVFFCISLASLLLSFV